MRNFIANPFHFQYKIGTAYIAYISLAEVKFTKEYYNKAKQMQYLSQQYCEYALQKITKRQDAVNHPPTNTNSVCIMEPLTQTGNIRTINISI